MSGREKYCNALAVTPGLILNRALIGIGRVVHDALLQTAPAFLT